MLEPVTTACLLGLLKTDKLVEFVVSGVLGNSAFTAVANSRKLARSLAEALADPALPENHDVLKATHAAFTQSLAHYANACQERFDWRTKASRAEREATGRVVRVVTSPKITEFAGGAVDLPREDLGAAIAALFGGAGPVTVIAERVLTALETDCGGTLPPRLRHLFLNGDDKQRSWARLFELLFAEQVKTSPRVQAITTYQGLQALQVQVGDLVELARREAEPIAKLRTELVDFWSELARQFAEAEAEAERRHAEAMARIADLDVKIERLITAMPSNAPVELLRALAIELGDRQPGYDLTELESFLRSGIAKYKDLDAKIDAIPARDNRANDLLQSARAALTAGRFDAVDTLLLEAEDLDDERIDDILIGKAGKRALRAEAAALRGDYPTAIRLYDEAFALLPAAARDAHDYDWRAASTTREWGERFGDLAALPEAIRRWRAMASTATPASELWASIQNNLGIALKVLGERQDDGAALTDAVAAYRAALTVYTRDAMPVDWAGTQNNLGAALRTLGARQDDGAALAEAVAAFRAALTVYTRDALPVYWAMTQNNLGIALATLGARQDDGAALAEAVAAYRAALTVRTREALPVQWATTQNNLGNVLVRLGERQDDGAALADAVAAFRAALTVYTREALPVDWAATQNNLGIALQTLGARQDDGAVLAEAVAAFRAALTVYTRDALPVDWAMTQNNLGNALRMLGARRDDGAALADAVAAFRAALTVYTRDALPVQWATAMENIGYALMAQARVTRSATDAADAVDSLAAAVAGFAHPSLAWNRAKAERGLAAARALLASLPG